MAKTECPVSLATFRADAADTIRVKIGDQDLLAVKKEFSTGAFGWYLTGKITVMVGDKPVTVQTGMNLIVVGSKEAPRGTDAPTAPAPDATPAPASNAAAILAALPE